MSGVNLHVNGPQTRGVRCESHGDNIHTLYSHHSSTRTRAHTHTHTHTYCRCISCICVRRMEYIYSVCIAHVFDDSSVSGLALMEYGIVVPCVFHVFHVYALSLIHI